ncbi:MAG: ABC transporter ATP-binding protein/permease [bacterium]|nr:ABC transporter ATP-binding protein/permease [bacterium]
MSELDEYDHEEPKKSGSLRQRVAALRRVLPYARPNLRQFVIGGTLMLLVTAATVAQPLLFRRIFDVNLPAKDVHGVIISASIFLALLLFSTILRYYESLILGLAGVSVVNRLKRVVFDKLMTFELSYYDKNPVGRLVARVESDCERLVGMFTAVGLQVVATGLLIIGTLAVLFPIEWRLALTLTGVVIVIVGGALYFFNRMRPRFREERSKVAAVIAVVSEFTQGARLLRILGREDYARKRLSDVNEEKVNYLFGTFMRFTGFFLPMGLLNVAAVGGILWYGADWTRVGAFTIGTVIMFAQYLTQLFHPLFELTEQLGEVQRALGSADRILEMMDRESIVQDQAKPVVLPKLTQSIELKNISFAYDPQKPVLKNVSLTIPAGSRIAIVGPTGGGKSTVINLLCRFYDPQEGSITWDGINLRNVAQRDIRSRIGLVLQDLYLFPGTVEENLKVMRDDVPRERVLRAIERLGTSEIINRMPKGLDTLFAERSANISYGERQLVAFTRALVFDPELLILDEATSSVDPETERRIEESLETLLAGRTSVIVAHRLSTIRNADAIAVIKNGEIIEFGKHEELLALHGFYARLYRIQFPEAARVKP